MGAALTGDAVRRRAELRAKASGLTAELAAWTELSQAGGRLEKHHTQVAAIVTALDAALAELGPRLEADDVEATWTGTERMLIRIHEVLDFFRAKLTLRMVDAFADYLAVADEFVWECYRPARDRAAGAVPKEPPLTFLGPATTPFTIPRGVSYARELGGAISSGTLRKVVDRLPVPVVGIPWFQLRHLPDALVLAHETGHLVETDFQLTPTLRTLLASAVPGERLATWRGRLGEAFADVYGALAGGPAFGGALADFIATTPASGSKLYPPPAIRLHLVAEALRASGLPADADALAARAETDAADLRADAGAVARAFVRGPYPQFGGVALDEVLHFRYRRDNADAVATALLRGRVYKGADDVRTLIAAAGLAFARNPLDYEATTVADKILAAARSRITSGVRAATGPREAADAHSTRDRDAGKAVFSLLAE
ncbi:hypothetical protein J5X84_41720 [Streptosporangiaceae bacterium NEAU-GS5]|nr:hypothetical protein [Streptosporangiaceae bacterium NEAU-GS5]